jgi:hypothetical protein
MIEPHAHLTGSVPGSDHPVKLQKLRLQYPQLDAESGHTCTGNIGQPFVICIGDDIKQLLDTVAPDRRDDPELCKMGPNRVDHCGLLADEQMARTMEHQAALLLGSLRRNEPHVRSGDRLADHLSVNCIVLMPFYIGLHISRRHQAHSVAKHLQLARPMM